jgi:signal transduction histidine kinase
VGRRGRTTAIPGTTIEATRPGHSRATVLVFGALQGLAALVAVAADGRGFEGALLVVVAGQLGELPIRQSVAWVVIQSGLLTCAIALVPDKPPADKVVLVALAFFTFQLFALFAVHTAHREAGARKELAAANAELQVAAGLLDISSRTSERLRIARDLHDLLGHHLTALTLNLEIASHVANDAAKDPIETSRSIAKRLLADVRDVVSRLREDDPLDLAAALAALTSVITSPVLHLDVAPDVAVRDPSIAQTTLRAVEEIVTNAVRHSGARNLWISLSVGDGSLSIEARDDGQGVDHVRFGNGLLGMRERVAAARGSMEVSSMRGEGFRVYVRLPM